MLHVIQRAKLFRHIVVADYIIRSQVEPFAEEACEPDNGLIRLIRKFAAFIRMAALNRDRIKIALIRRIRPFTCRNTLDNLSLDSDDKMAAGLCFLRLRQVFKVVAVVHRCAARVCSIVNDNAFYLFQPGLRSGPAVWR